MYRLHAKESRYKIIMLMLKFVDHQVKRVYRLLADHDNVLCLYGIFKEQTGVGIPANQLSS